MRAIGWTELLVAAVLCGCATSGGPGGAGGQEIVVAVPIAAFVTPERPAHARVEVTDIRREATMERTALGVSMGRIRIEPPVVELVAAAVRAAAADVGQASTAPSPTVLCGIRKFDVATPSTPLYWDIDVTIEVVLRVGGQDREVSASATDRTWTWPSAGLIGEVTADALRELVVRSAEALRPLAATP